MTALSWLNWILYYGGLFALILLAYAVSAFLLYELWKEKQDMKSRDKFYEDKGYELGLREKAIVSAQSRSDT